MIDNIDSTLNLDYGSDREQFIRKKSKTYRIGNKVNEFNELIPSFDEKERGNDIGKFVIENEDDFDI